MSPPKGPRVSEIGIRHPWILCMWKIFKKYLVIPNYQCHIAITVCEKSAFVDIKATGISKIPG